MNSEPASLGLSVHELSLYNVGRLSPEKIIASFAARTEQFGRILADIGNERPDGRAQHHLVVGQRGMGKTMLLARIAAELCTNPGLRGRFIPLSFAEEQYAVDRLSKFWLNCLDSLADVLEESSGCGAVAEIDAVVAQLTAAAPRLGADDQAFADEVYGAFSKVSAAGGRRPVLLVDNLQLVFERLEKSQQHSLREILMRPGAPILIGASPSPPPQSQDYGAAFYDHFKVHYLRPLQELEMRSLLVHLADAVGRSDVKHRVAEHPGRLKALRQLTGGNPRTTLTLFLLYSEDFAPSVFGTLEALLDRMTPLYKARFEELTPQQQVIFSDIANHWDPVSAAVLAQSTQLPAGTISAQLDRLEKCGAIERVELFGESRNGYQIGERFFNIWFLMRSASRRQRREVEFLTRFLQSFYEPSERAHLARQLLKEPEFSPDRYLWCCAVAGSVDEPELAGDLQRHIEIQTLNQASGEARRRMHELLASDTLSPVSLEFDAIRRKLFSLVPDNSEIRAEDFVEAVIGDISLFETGMRNLFAAQESTLGPESIRTVLESTRQNKKYDVARFGEEAVSWFSERLVSGQLRNCRDPVDWNRAFLHAPSRPVVALMVRTMPDRFGPELSLSAHRKILAILRPDHDSPDRDWIMWAFACHAKLCFYEDAEVAYRELIRRNVFTDWAWYNLATLLHSCLSNYAEAELAYRAGTISGDFKAQCWRGLGDLLYHRLLRFREATDAYREAIKLSPTDTKSLNNLGNLCCDFFGQFEQADCAYGEALKLDPDNTVIRQNQIFLRRDYLGQGLAAFPMFDALTKIGNHEFQDTTHLHEALFRAYESNWGLAVTALNKAIALRSNGFSPLNTDDWLRASAVFVHLDYGAELLAQLDRSGVTSRLRPWVEALRAIQIGDRRALLNVAPEIRATSEVLYDGIKRRLLLLPKETCRRTSSAKKSRRSGRRGTT